MKSSIIVLGSVLALALAGCATSTDGDKMAMPAPMDADALAAAFKAGSPTCKVTLADGTAGQDFYYKTGGSYSGDVDRTIGDKLLQGTWKISGSAFYTNFGSGKKALGDWFKVIESGKKTYDFYSGDGTKQHTLKC